MMGGYDGGQNRGAGKVGQGKGDGKKEKDGKPLDPTVMLGGYGVVEESRPPKSPKLEEG